MDRYDYLMKFLIIGNAGTGKTCIMRYFLDSKFKEDSLHTIGVEFGTKIIRIDEKSIKLQIWDTAGILLFKLRLLQVKKGFNVSRDLIIEVLLVL